MRTAWPGESDQTALVIGMALVTAMWLVGVLG